MAAYFSLTTRHRHALIALCLPFFVCRVKTLNDDHHQPKAGEEKWPK